MRTFHLQGQGRARAPRGTWTGLWAGAVVGGWVLVGTACGGRVDAAENKPGAAARQAPADGAVKVETVDVKEHKVPRFLTLTGSLAANEDADVAAGVTGKVVSVHAERGSVVKKGEVMARLDARAASASLDEARAQVVQAKSQQVLANADCERNEKLFASGTISAADHDRAQAQCRNAAAMVTGTQARLALLEINVSDAAIKAPFDGVVSERVVSVGEYVQPPTKVVTLVSLDPLRLQLTVPESSAALIQREQPVEFTLTAAPNVVHKAKVAYVGAGLRSGSRDLVVEALVPNKDRTLLPGQFATARVQLGEQPLPVVPRAAILEDGGRRKLFVVSDGRLEERFVQMGDGAGDDVGVLAGVRVGERVVAVARPELRDGMKLQ